MDTICLNCEHARRSASDENTKLGWCGCAEITRANGDIKFSINYEEAGEGWVDLKSRPNSKSSGVLTNCQTLIRNVSKCSQFTKLA